MSVHPCTRKGLRQDALSFPPLLYTFSTSLKLLHSSFTASQPLVQEVPIPPIMNSTEKRLLKEYRSVSRELSLATSSLRKSGILLLEPSSPSDILTWKATIEGPKSTPFENTTWDLDVQIPINYPLEPPKIRFVTLSEERIAELQRERRTNDVPPKCFKMPHPNINFKTGEICLDILQKKWSPAWTLQSSVIAIIVLLSNPEPLSPLNIDLANLLKCGDTVAYEATIAYYIGRYSV